MGPVARPSRAGSGRSDRRGEIPERGELHHTSTATAAREDKDEYLSPLKKCAPESEHHDTGISGPGRQLFQAENRERRMVVKNENQNARGSLLPRHRA
jgi:hypothetical protein